MSCVVFAHLELQRTRSPFSTEGAALAHISNYEVRGGGVESSLPLHRCRPRPPFTLTVIDELRASPRQSRRPTTVSCLSGTKTVLSAEAAASSTFSGVNLTGREMGLNPPGEGEPSGGGHASPNRSHQRFLVRSEGFVGLGSLMQLVSAAAFGLPGYGARATTRMRRRPCWSHAIPFSSGMFPTGGCSLKLGCIKNKL